MLITLVFAHSLHGYGVSTRHYHGTPAPGSVAKVKLNAIRRRAIASQVFLAE